MLDAAASVGVMWRTVPAQCETGKRFAQISTMSDFPMFVSLVIDSGSSTTVSSSRLKTPPGTQPPDASKGAADVAPAPTAAPLAVNQIQDATIFHMAAPASVMADSQQPQQQPQQQQQATASLQIPPRDHVAPKSYERWDCMGITNLWGSSVVIGPGRAGTSTTHLCRRRGGIRLLP
jgi:hypothetical protein